jgi:hypothetical protein
MPSRYSLIYIKHPETLLWAYLSTLPLVATFPSVGLSGGLSSSLVVLGLYEQIEIIIMGKRYELQVL